MKDALLLTMMNPPAGGDEEFNDWVNTEHLPERKIIPGIRLAQRFRNRQQSPRYMAFYDLESLDVLKSAPYRAIAGENLSPWSKRILASATARWRFEGDLIYSDGDEAWGTREVADVLLIAWREVRERRNQEICEALKTASATIHAALWRRVYANRSEAAIDYVAIVGAGLPIDLTYTQENNYSASGAACDFAQIFHPV